MTIEEVYRHPADYDLELSDRDVQDFPFWLDLVSRERPASILEVGCGTGRLTIPLAREGARAGFRVMGIDPEQAMLEQAAMWLQAEPANVRDTLELRDGDMRSLALGREFDLIIMPYGAAHHLLTLEDQLAVFRNARRHLPERGLFVLDVGAPCIDDLSALARGIARHQDIDARRPDGRRLRRLVASRYAPSRQRATHDYEYVVTDEAGDERRYLSTFEMHIYFPRELELLCGAAAFTCESIVGAYDGTAYDDGARQMIVLARAC